VTTEGRCVCRWGCHRTHPCPVCGRFGRFALRAYWWRLETPDMTCEGFRHAADPSEISEWIATRYESWISYLAEKSAVRLVVRGFLTHKAGPRIVYESRGSLLTRPAPSVYVGGVISPGEVE